MPVPTDTTDRRSDPSALRSYPAPSSPRVRRRDDRGHRNDIDAMSAMPRARPAREEVKFAEARQPTLERHLHRRSPSMRFRQLAPFASSPRATGEREGTIASAMGRVRWRRRKRSESHLSPTRAPGGAESGDERVPDV
jgi:hypothetical protein